MKNFVSAGKTLLYTAGANISSGQVVNLTTMIGIAVTDIANGASGAVELEGVFELTKKSGDTFAVGTKVYWDPTNLYLTTTSTSNVVAGAAVEAAGSAAVLGKVKLIPGL